MITLEQLERAIIPHFQFIKDHPYRKLQTIASKSGSQNMGIIIFCGIAEQCNIPGHEVRDFLNDMPAVTHQEMINRYNYYIRTAQDESRIIMHPDLAGIAYRKSMLVKNYIRNYYKEIILPDFSPLPTKKFFYDE